MLNPFANGVKRAQVLAVLALFAGTLAINAPANAYHSWVNFHWPRSANPATLTYRTSFQSGSALNTTWGTLTTKVIGEWGGVTQYKAGTFDVFNFTKVASGGQILVESGNYGANGWFGLATVNVNVLNGHISSGNVKVNDYYFSSAYGNDTARDHVLCQEVGHVLGLDHNTLPLLFGRSCMNDNNATLNDAAYRTPNAHDAEQLNLSYTHKDTGGPIGLVQTIILDVIPA